MAGALNVPERQLSTAMKSAGSLPRQLGFKPWLSHVLTAGP